jgi:hypothetical protein
MSDFDHWFAEYNNENHGRNDAAEAAWDHQQRTIDALRAFAQEVMEFSPLGYTDGLDLQAIACKHGLMATDRRVMPCAEGSACTCRAIYSKRALGREINCTHKTPLLIGG